MANSPPEQSRAFEIGGHSIAPGEREEISLPVERLATGPWISIPTVVMNGRRPGPALAVCAAIHGDEINGVEAIRRLLQEIRPQDLIGTLVAVPVVNELGFMSGERYLPDRRDLNRAFPGSPRGSLASRIAHLFMTEVIEKCEYGIDLHCGADMRTNHPQLRADLDDSRTKACAEAFGAPVTIHARTRDRSLREAATEKGMAMLLFEGGESRRYNVYAIEAAYLGILRVMGHLGMISNGPGAPRSPSFMSRETRWVRAPRGGLMRLDVGLGQPVEARQVLAHLSDIFGRRNLVVRAPLSGMVIGLTRNPLVSQGDALFHIAEPWSVAEDEIDEDGG